MKKMLLITFITFVLFSASFVLATPICGDGICEGVEKNVETSQGCPADCYTDPIVVTPENVLDKELSNLTLSTVLINKYIVEFDNAKTYTIWLYAQEEPTREEVIQVIDPLAKELTNNIKGYSFNFEIFPENSTKTPQNSQMYDSYVNIVYRNGEIIFPVDYQSKSDIKKECLGEKENGKCYMNLSNGRKAEIKFMPETASQKAIERLGQLNFTIQLKEVGEGNNSKAIYELNTKKEYKIFGFIKNDAKVSIQVDAETGEVVKIKRPWWSFMATSS